ncbi:MAG: hypothetical protein Q9181_001975 [Wetmoreana brouardii]
MEPQPDKTHSPSSTHGLPSLSATSPLNNITSTDETLPPSPSPSPNNHTIHKQSAQTRQNRTIAIQNAKREVLANIKEDWTWPPSTLSCENRFPRRRPSTKWRERESDCSPLASRSPSPSSKDPYRFESPDSVGTPLNESTRAKKRKLINDEVEWNVGLKTFIERRDYWTGAEVQPVGKESREHKPSSSDSVSRKLSRFGIDQETAPATAASSQSSDRLQLSETTSSSPASNRSLPTPSSSPIFSPISSTRVSQASEVSCSAPVYSSSPSQFQTTANDPDEDMMTLIPIAPPLLSPTTHPSLPPILTSTYPTIYSKVVIQSLAPSVPINLSHIVGSLVQGWKEDGEWPPKASIQEQKGPRKDSLKEKMRALRVGEGGAGDVGLRERVARRGVGKVRRALGR